MWMRVIAMLHVLVILAKSVEGGGEIRVCQQPSKILSSFLVHSTFTVNYKLLITQAIANWVTSNMLYNEHLFVESILSFVGSATVNCCLSKSYFENVLTKVLWAKRAIKFWREILLKIRKQTSFQHNPSQKLPLPDYLIIHFKFMAHTGIEGIGPSNS